MKVCNVCEVELTEKNTTAGARKHGVNRCRACVNEQSKLSRMRPFGIDEKHNCRVCKVELTEETWNKGSRKHKQYLCKECQRKAQNKIRLDIVNHYGSKCAYCGSTEDLQIDHIEGNGKAHREELGDGATIYYWIKRNNYPTGFQVLCKKHNVNKGSMSDSEYRELIYGTYHAMKDR